MGRPAVFLRLSGCTPPLCPWCDSRHAWEPGERMTIDAVLEKILAFGCDFVVITGGEPFLQWDTGLYRLVSLLASEGYEIQYETSGKVPLPAELYGYAVCSPKFLDGKWRFDETNVGRADAFKFVVEEDLDGILAFIEEHKIARKKVWLMPMGETRKEQLARSSALWRLCTEKRLNFSARLHILAFDDLKGV